jgi:hypothetical protein
MRSVREPIIRLLAPLALLGLLAAGCGDDEESLSEDEFIEQANAICEEGSEELDEAGDELFGNEEPTPEQIADFADVFEDAIGDQIDDIDDLNGPSDLEEDLADVLADARDTLSEFADQVRDDPEAAFTSEEDPFADINERMSALGLTSCAE